MADTENVPKNAAQLIKEAASGHTNQCLGKTLYN